MTWQDTKNCLIIAGIMGLFFGLIGQVCEGWHTAWRAAILVFTIMSIFLVGVGSVGEE